MSLKNSLTDKVASRQEQVDPSGNNSMISFAHGIQPLGCVALNVERKIPIKNAGPVIKANFFRLSDNWIALPYEISLVEIFQSPIDL